MRRGLLVCRQLRSSLAVCVSVKFTSDSICGCRRHCKLPVCPVVTWWCVYAALTATTLCLCAYNVPLNTLALGASISDLCVSLCDSVCRGLGYMAEASWVCAYNLLPIPSLKVLVYIRV